MAGAQVGGRGRRPRGVLLSDAAPGQLVLVVYGACGERLMRLEVSEALYATPILDWLECWLAEVDRPRLSLIRS